MVGRLSHCYLLAFRARPEGVQGLLPPKLDAFTKDGWAYWNVVVSKVDRMRPRGVPRLLGSSYIHIAYRIYAQAKTRSGDMVEGLFFVRSDVDDAMMARMGNVMTDFRFHRSRIDWRSDDGALVVDVKGTDQARADAHVRLDLKASKGVTAPPAFLKYAPFGLATDGAGRRLRLAEVLRDEANWSERPVKVAEARWSLFDSLAQQDLSLVGATEVAPIDYRWRIGRTLALA